MVRVEAPVSQLSLEGFQAIARGGDSIVYSDGTYILKSYAAEGGIALPQVQLYAEVTNEIARTLKQREFGLQLHDGAPQMSVFVNPVLKVGRSGSGVSSSISCHIHGQSLSRLTYCSHGSTLVVPRLLDAMPGLKPERIRLSSSLHKMSETLMGSFHVRGIDITPGNVMVVDIDTEPYLVLTDLCASVRALRRITTND